MPSEITLPMGSQANWELESPEDGASALRSIKESFVVAYSLKQSREKWLTSTFPRFSVKSRGGKAAAAAIQPPPHTIKSHGRFDLVVGPHVFSNTSIFEVHYLPQQTSVSSNHQAPAPATGMLHPIAGPSTIPPPSHPSSVAAPALSTLSADTVVAPEVTPELIEHMNAAAESNPTLLNLLQEVARGHATQSQKETLSLLMQQFNASVKPGDQTHASVTPAAVPTPPRLTTARPDFDVVLEFTEKPGDRWIFPRGPVNIQRVPGHRGDDLIVNAVLPFSQGTPSSDGETKPSEIVAFRFAGVLFTVHDLIMRWMGGPDSYAEHARKINEVAAKLPTRQFLQHRLPPGDLLDQLRAAVTPTYATKSIKPTHADSGRAKRRPTRKAVTETSQASTTPTGDAPPPKRRKSTATKRKSPSATATPIACHSCGQTDVPLMMGGRYCRECVSAGKISADIPTLSPVRPATATERSPSTVGRRGSTLAAPPLVAHSPLATNPPVMFAPVQTPQNIQQEQKSKDA